MASNGLNIARHLNLKPQDSAPSNPVEGDVYFDKTDNKAYIRRNSAWKDLTDQGIKNYIKDGEFNSIQDVTTYDDTSTYVDGTGGSPSVITVSRNTTTPLTGTADLKITKAASDGSGEGATIISETINKADRGRRLWFSLEWDGVNVPADDLTLKAFDVADNKVLNVYGVSGCDKDGNLPKAKTKVLAYVDTSSNTTGTVRLSLHLESDSDTGNSWDAFVGDVKLSPEATVPAVIQTEWEDFTPVFSNWDGTFTTSMARWRRDGPDLLIELRINVDTAGTTSDIALDNPVANKTINTSSQITGFYSIFDYNGGSSWQHGTLAHNSNAITMVNIGQSGLLDSSHLSSSSIIKMKVRTKIDEWSSGASFSTTEVNLQTNKASGTMVSPSGGTGTFALTPVVDDKEMVQSDQIVIPQTGFYKIEVAAITAETAWSAANNGFLIEIFKDTGSGFSKIDNNIRDESRAAATFQIGVAGSYSDNFNEGDVIELRHLASITTSATGTFSITQEPDFTHFSVWGENDFVPAVSSTKSITTTEENTWLQMIGNSVVLPKGTYMLHGDIVIAGSTNAPNIHFVRARWASENGDDTGTQPSFTPLSFDFGSAEPLREGGGSITESIGRYFYHPTQTARITVSEDTEVFLVPLVVAQGGLSGSDTINATVRIYAERIA